MSNMVSMVLKLSKVFSESGKIPQNTQMASGWWEGCKLAYLEGQVGKDDYEKAGKYLVSIGAIKRDNIKSLPQLLENRKLAIGLANFYFACYSKRCLQKTPKQKAKTDSNLVSLVVDNLKSSVTVNS